MTITRSPFGPRSLSRSLAQFSCSYLTGPAPTTCRFSTKAEQKNGQIRSTKARPRQGQPTGSKDNSRRKMAKNMAKSGLNKSILEGGMKRFVPLNVQKFWRPGQKLWTTPDMWEFFEETGIGYDTSLTRRLPLSVENKSIYKRFACNVHFSDDYIVNPYHLVMAQPWGHPLAEKFKSDYREKIRDEPLWLHFFTYGDASMIVRNITKQRLAKEFWTWLEKLEREHPGQSRLKGTVIVELKDPREAAKTPAFQFGKAVAEAVLTERSYKKYDT